MRLIKRGKYYVCRYSTGKGTKEVSTRCTERSDALKVVAEAKIEQIELSARAGVLSQQVFNSIVRGGQKLNLESLAEEYKSWCASVNLSPATIHGRLSVICHFLRFADLKKVSPEDVTTAHVSLFINRPAKAKANSRTLALENLRLFFDWLKNRGMTTQNVARLVKLDLGALNHEQKEPKIREPITDEEYECLIRQCEMRGESFWLCAITLGRKTGLRLGDICTLEKASAKETLTVWTKKTDARVDLTVQEDLLCMLNIAGSENESPYFFPAERLTYLDPETRCQLSMAFRRLADRCGVRGSFHCLRHSRATEITNESGITEAAKQLGHSSTKTTEIYVK